MNGPFSSFLEKDFEICKSDDWVIRVLVIVTDRFQNRAENWMFGHPTRNAFALVAPNCRFLNDDTWSCMVTRKRPFSRILKYMRIAMEIACFSWEIINALSILDNVRIVPSAVESFLAKSG